MKLSYSIGKTKIEKDVSKADFMLTNRLGGYAYFSDKPNSRYQGFFFNDNLKMFRVIENISLVKKRPIKSLKNKFYIVERSYDDLVESFFIPRDFNSLVYELSKEDEIELALDVKESYDNREFGRVYDIEVDGDKIVVKFTKRTNISEDDSEGQEEYVIYLAIKADKLNYEIIDEWEKRDYSDDRARGSSPFERYVYSALRLKGKTFVFAASNDKAKAVKEASRVYANRNKLKKESEKLFNRIINAPIIKNIKDDETRLAYISALNSLDGLRVKTKEEEGIFAGLPWFFQLWARDELISLKGLFSLKGNRTIRNILMKYFFNLKDGRLKTKFHEESIGSSDAVGWLYFRTKEAFNKKIFNKNEIKKITKILEENADYLIQDSTDELAVCGEKETWMDSLKRDGALIEIQALRLCVYNVLYSLTKKKKYKELRERLKSKVREKFWNGEYLTDSLDEPLIRPNLFIAAYVYPELLSKEEWSTCFENVLPKLFVDWGGLSTVDKTNPLFTSKHTGEDPKSYHNGDSWFWINNLAAIVLNRVDKKKFSRYIKKILDASAKELLYSGISGCGAELSSASELKSEGCLNQAWSSAMFIELVEGLF